MSATSNLNDNTMLILFILNINNEILYPKSALPLMPQSFQNRMVLEF